MRKSESELTKTYYYLLNIVDNRLYSNIKIANEYTTMSTKEQKQCVLYVSLNEAVEARKRIPLETLNIMTIEKKVSKLEEVL
jgi:hypothetical protein